MKIQILVPDLPHKTGLKQGSNAFVKKVRTIGDKLMFGVKSPNRGIVWFAQNEVRQV